jgi:hypothetical protein
LARLCFCPGRLVVTVLGLDLTSVLHPVWQAGVAVRLVLALRQTKLS